MSEPRDEALPEQLHEKLLAERDRTQPPTRLRDSVLEALRADGQLSEPQGDSRRRRRWVSAAIAASLLLAFAAGHWFAGQQAAVPPEDTRALFLLLLREPPEGLRVAGLTEADLVAEYSDWARTQAAAGRLVRGEKLALQELTIGPLAAVAEPPASRVTGFFLVRAESLEAAERIARSCPHVEYGGSIELRPVETT